MLFLLWTQLYVSCVHAWQHGEYYSYGWYVPPLALLFIFRLRGLLVPVKPKRLSGAAIATGLVSLFLALTALRVLHRVDPRWTFPIWCQALLVTAITFYTLHRLGGRRAARRSIPVIIFACSALPLPSVLERFVVSHLTDSVIAATARVLGLLGRPVTAIGDQLGRLGEVVQVTEGCSGIRSAQSFLMAALFFGEWMELRSAGRWLMVAAGLITAWVLNVARATSLAWIRFERGDEAFAAAHDLAGLLAFLTGSAILLGVSSALDSRQPGGHLVRTVRERRSA